MKNRMLHVVAVVALAIAAPAALNAQSLYISGGAGFPTGDFGDLAKTGWQVAGGIMFDDIGAPGLSLGVDGSYGQNNFKDPSVIGFDISGAALTYGIMATALYGFANDGRFEPYLFGGVGWLGVDGYFGATDGSSTEIQKDSDSSFGYQLGAGIGYGLSGSISIYGEGRYTGGTGDLSSIKWLSLLAGFSFDL